MGQLKDLLPQILTSGFGSLFSELCVKPCPRHGPFAFNGAGGNAQDLCNLFHSQSAKKSHFDDLLLAGIERRQSAEGIIDGEHADRGIGAKVQRIFDWDDGLPTAAPGTEVGARMIDEDTTHEMRGNGEKVRAVPEVRFALLDELQVGFVDEGGGLQRVIGAFATHVVRRAAMQLIVDQGHEALDYALVAAGQSRQQGRDFS